jgi:hypothetical protein
MNRDFILELAQKYRIYVFDVQRILIDKAIAEGLWFYERRNYRDGPSANVIASPKEMSEDFEQGCFDIQRIESLGLKNPQDHLADLRTREPEDGMVISHFKKRMAESKKWERLQAPTPPEEQTP